MLEGSLGFIKINRFSESTYSNLKNPWMYYWTKGMKSLVLDLRDNPGYISSAEKILDEFLGDDTLLLITKNKAGEETYSYASGKGNSRQGSSSYSLMKIRHLPARL